MFPVDLLFHGFLDVEFRLLWKSVKSSFQNRVGPLLTTVGPYLIQTGVGFGMVIESLPYTCRCREVYYRTLCRLYILQLILDCLSQFLLCLVTPIDSHTHLYDHPLVITIFVKIHIISLRIMASATPGTKEGTSTQETLS